MPNKIDQYLVPEPFIVIDQNKCRDKAFVDALFQRCVREGLKILLPEVAIYEFSKGKRVYETWRQSLEHLSQHPELVVAGRSLDELMHIEVNSGKPCLEIVDSVVTPGFQRLLDGVRSGDDKALNEALANLAKIIGDEKKRQSKHKLNKSIVVRLRDGWKKSVSAADLKALRNGDQATAVRLLSLVETASVIFHAAKKDGCTDEGSYWLTVRPSIYSHRVYCLAALALDWLSEGGLDSVKEDKITNDLHDIDYVCTATFCVDLITEDKRANRVHLCLTEAFKLRWRYIKIMDIIQEYLAGPQKLRDAIDGMTGEQIDAAPVPGKWSTRQVICHIADFEPVYADRMKRALAEDEPTIFGGDPDAFAARLAYEHREIEEELQMIESVRKHMARILRTLQPDDFQRTANHSETGPLTVEQLLTNITNHIPHHINFIDEKRAAMA